MSDKVNCPNCLVPMKVSYDKGNVKLYKCSGCGRIRLVQDWESNNVRVGSIKKPS